LKKKTLFLKRIAIGLGVWLPILAVAQVYVFVASWFEVPANGLLRIPVFGSLFAHVPFLMFLQHVMSIGVGLAIVLTILFLTGAFVMTWLGKKVRTIVETRLLRFFPLFSFFKKIVVLFAGENGENSFLSRFECTAFVHIYGNETFVTALVTAGHHTSGGIRTAYVPSVPNITAGRIYNVPAEWVHILNIPPGDMVAAVAAWGMGTEKLVARHVDDRIETPGAGIPECFLREQCPLQRDIDAVLFSRRCSRS
jgi:uncharacterized membrane protein